jgi:type I restriction enzyme S subunit
MKRYPEYKDSGIDWIGEIPINWSIKKLKFFSRIVLGKMLTNEDKGGYFYKPYLRAQNINWFNVNSEDIKKMWFSENELSQYRIKKDDLLVSEGGEVGRTCMWNNEIDECYIQNSVHKVTVNGENAPRFFQYFFYAIGTIGHFDAIVSRVSIAHLTREKLKEVSFFVPDQKQQTIIATFLDLKTSHIDDLIAKKQKLIELLKEERTAIINQTITKGLDPSVPMRDSGIEWLGEIPKHWDIKRLKLLAKTIQTGNTPPSEKREYYDNPDLNWFTPSDFGDNLFLKDSSRKINSKAITDCVAKIFNPHSVLIIGIGATLGKIGIIEMPASSNQQINSIEFNNLMNPIFGAYFLKTFESVIKNMSNAATLAILNQTNTKGIILTCPPKEEQDTIVKFIVEMYSHVESTISRIEKEVELLSEYKTSLINEAVTGKIDVRDYQINHA